MKRAPIYMFSILSITIITTCLSAGMLTPAQFPKNTDDLTFSQRVDLLTDGYSAFDTVFDSNGKCIENCPYVGMTIQEFNHRMDVAEQQVQQDLAELNLQNPVTPDSIDDTTTSSENNIQFDTNGVCIENCNGVENIQEYNNRIATASQQHTQSSSDLFPNRGSESENGAITDYASVSHVNYAGNISPSQSGRLIDELRQKKRQSNNQQLHDIEALFESRQRQNQNNSYSSNGTLPVTCPLGNGSIRVSDNVRCRNKSTKRNHNGIDLPVRVGSPVYAAADGRVVIRKENPGGYGNYLSIEHAKGYYTVYGHLSQWLVSDGQTVRAGQQIAKSGNTGRSTGPHLHFEVLKGGPLVRGYGGVPVNPRNITNCKWDPKNNSSNTSNNRC